MNDTSKMTAEQYAAHTGKMSFPAGWVAKKEVRPADEVEQEYGLPPGSLVEACQVCGKPRADGLLPDYCSDCSPKPNAENTHRKCKGCLLFLPIERFNVHHPMVCDHCFEKNAASPIGPRGDMPPNTYATNSASPTHQTMPPIVTDWQFHAKDMAARAMKLEKELREALVEANKFREERNELSEKIRDYASKLGDEKQNAKELTAAMAQQNGECAEVNRKYDEALKASHGFREQRNDLSEKYAAKCGDYERLTEKAARAEQFQRKAIEAEDKLGRVQRELTQREKDVVAKVNSLEMAHSQNRHLQDGIIKLQKRVKTLEKTLETSEEANDHWENRYDAVFQSVRTKEARIVELENLADTYKNDWRQASRAGGCAIAWALITTLVAILAVTLR